jgi:phosphoglycerol transferase
MRTILRPAWQYGLCLSACGLLLAWLFDLPHRDLRAPLHYGGDALDNLMVAKSILEHGWVLHNPDLGAPHGCDLHDYQRGATLQFLSLKLLGPAVGDPLLLANVYFLLSFPLTALTALLVLRHFRLAYWPALAAALLYAFLSYHTLRGVGHLFLAVYYVLPPAVAVVLWVFLEEPLFGRPAARLCTPRGWAALLVAVLVACTDIYYAFFTCFFLLTAGLAVSWRKGRLVPCAPSLLLIGVVTAATAASFVPQVLYARAHGPNREAGRRASSDAEHYGLRLTQMLAPVTDHRLPLLARAKRQFNAKLPSFTESDTASLGALGTVGLLFLLGLLLVPAPPGDPRRAVLQGLSVLTVAAILVGSVGGVCLFIASVFPYIRCYNRLSVYVGFFSLFALAHLLERLLARLPQGPGWRAGGAALCLALAAGGAWDQTPALPDDRATLAGLASDRAFVGRLEERLPAGAMVYQLPYFAYPEGDSYDPLRLYLCSHQLRWSFAAMRGRYADLWQRHTAAQPTADCADALSWAGFAGVCWDRGASKPADRQAEARWRALLGAPQLVSPDGRVAYYSLAAHADRLRRGVSPEEARLRRQEALGPVLLCWGAGFQQTEDPGPQGRWANRQGELVLFNPGDGPRRVTLELRVRTFQPGPATLRLSAPGLDQAETVAGAARVVRAEVTAPPGRSCLRVRCDGAADPEQARHVWLVLGHAVRVAPAAHGLARFE